ncbi:hypothetical protein ACF06V_38300 [Streptomyces bobili]
MGGFAVNAAAPSGRWPTFTDADNQDALTLLHARRDEVLQVN